MDVQIPCACPSPDGQSPHPFDTVTLHEPLEPRVRRAVLYQVNLAVPEDGLDGERMAILNECYVLMCIDRWTLRGWVTDEHGKPKISALPPSRENIRARILSDDRTYDLVGKAADGLYSEAVLLPLMAGASSFSPPSPTDAQTSPPTNGTTPHRRRSRRSSTTTTPTVAIGPTPSSNGGVSSSSAS